MSTLQKNTAGQRIRVFAFNVTTGLPVTGDAANITCKLSIDYASPVALTDTNPDEIEDGYYHFLPTQAETNGDVLEAYPESSTANVQVIVADGLQADSLVSQLTNSLSAGASLLSVFDASRNRLTLVADTDYSDSAASGAIRVAVTASNVTDGDTVEFGASYTDSAGTTTTITSSGTVATESGTQYAIVTLTDDDTNVPPSSSWRWSLIHETSGGLRTGLVADAPMTILENQAAE